MDDSALGHVEESSLLPVDGIERISQHGAVNCGPKLILNLIHRSSLTRVRNQWIWFATLVHERATS